MQTLKKQTTKQFIAMHKARLKRKKLKELEAFKTTNEKENYMEYLDDLDLERLELEIELTVDSDVDLE
jgi:hypothetical protein